VRLEAFTLSASDSAFWAACAAPQRAAKQLGDPFVDYLRRTLAYLAPLTRPSDLAWLLASYAREALRRIESHVNLPALATVRGGLEQALGLRFDDAKGEHFFRSTLVQTIFYGIFSAWVQWAREQPVNFHRNGTPNLRPKGTPRTLSMIGAGGPAARPGASATIMVAKGLVRAQGSRLAKRPA